MERAKKDKRPQICPFFLRSHWSFFGDEIEEAAKKCTLVRPCGDGYHCLQEFCCRRRHRPVKHCNHEKCSFALELDIIRFWLDSRRYWLKTNFSKRRCIHMLNTCKYCDKILLKLVVDHYILWNWRLKLILTENFFKIASKITSTYCYNTVLVSTYYTCRWTHFSKIR